MNATGFQVYDKKNEEFVDSHKFVVRGDGELFKMYVNRAGRVASRTCNEDRFKVIPKDEEQ